MAAALLGPPVERRGLTSGSLGWYCPFHRGASPSFRVNLGEPVWSCSACGAGGDAAALVMRIKGIGFRDAIAWLDEQDGFDFAQVVDADDHAAPRAIYGPRLHLDHYTVGEGKIMIASNGGAAGTVAGGAARPR